MEIIDISKDAVVWILRQMVRQVGAGESPLSIDQTSHISNWKVFGEEAFILEGTIFVQ